jgi:transposase InsO family protein
MQGVLARIDADGGCGCSGCVMGHSDVLLVLLSPRSFSERFGAGARPVHPIPRHPWTNGQVERMNRTLKDATVKRYFYETHEQLRTHLTDFVMAYNFARRLKTLKGLTP